MAQTISRLTDDTRLAGLCSSSNYLLYDGECPFCARYVVYTKARQAFDSLELLDARKYPNLVRYWREKGLELNDGMLLVVNGQTYYGDKAVHALALASTQSDIFNHMNALVFRSRFISKILYPVLRAGRNITIRMLRRSRL